jgi:Mg2+ and Co2+ transporter CorA
MCSLASEYLEHGKKETEKFNGSEKLGRILLCLYIVTFAFWAFDVSTTFYAINVLGVAGEENPLGWPFGVWGALIFYVPALVFTYLLLFRAKNKYSPGAATLITALALLSGILNLLAGLHNLSIISNFLQW